MRMQTLTLALTLALFAGAPAALAQDKSPLQGPKVVPNRPAELEDEFAPAGGKGDKFSRREPPIPMRAYVQAVNKLKGDDAPAELKLTEAQQHKIEAVVQEFRQAAQEAQRRSQSEMDAERPKDGKPGDEMEPARRRPAGEGNEPARERIQALRRNGPSPQEYETKIWNALTEGQQKFVQADLDALREEQRKRQGEEYMRREVEKRRAKEGKDAAKPGDEAAPRRPLADPQGGGPSPEMRERAQRIFERLRQLSPEDREAVLRRLEEDIARHSGDGGGKPADETSPGPKRKKAALSKPGKGGLRGEQPGDDAKPAPGMEEVKVPPARKP